MPLETTLYRGLDLLKQADENLNYPLVAYNNKAAVLIH